MAIAQRRTRLSTILAQSADNKRNIIIINKKIKKIREVE